jgi:response regulator RpfG family c-di-GMP phosphodiesterase
MTSPSETTLLRRAAHVHDVGRFGVPGNVLDKPGPLNGAEMERMRMRVLCRADLQPTRAVATGVVAATHHERMDGSGHHRSVGGVIHPSFPDPAAAGLHDAMTSPVRTATP